MRAQNGGARTHAGHIVTNQHVVAGASDLRVTTIDQSAYKAKVLGFDEDKDVAVLQVPIKSKQKPQPSRRLFSGKRCVVHFQ